MRDDQEGDVIKVVGGRLKGTTGRVSHIIPAQPGEHLARVAFYEDGTDRLRYAAVDRVILLERHCHLHCSHEHCGDEKEIEG